MKTIYGHHISYEEALEKSGIKTLYERRNDAFDKFCLKTEKNPSFSHWLPRVEFTHYDLRRGRIFEEEFARTEKLYKSPLFTMRRRLNEISELNFVPQS